MVFTILGGCFSCVNNTNVCELECTNGTYGSYYGLGHLVSSPNRCNKSCNLINKGRSWFFENGVCRLETIKKEDVIKVN